MAMVLEKQILPLGQWLGAGWLWFALLAVLLAVGGLFLGYLVSALRYGPLRGLRHVGSALYQGAIDLASVSPRRVLAIARLAFQESIRRRVLVVFAVFILCLSFAGWFLDRQADHPARLYLSFVLTTTSYLVMLLAIFLAAFSLPTDIKNHTIYTVVTKPVRAWELVAGRIIGFAAIGTLLLAVMGLCSYIFVLRGVQHTHIVDQRDLVTQENRDSIFQARQTGHTSLARHHRHEVAIDKDGKLLVSREQDHTHTVVATRGEGNDKRYVLSGPVGMFEARVPIRGTLRFLDRDGRPAAKGINVGDEWTYRSYIEGGTFAAAIWTYEGISARRFPEGLPLEMTLQVFRTYQGNIEQGIAGKIEVVSPNPDRPLKSQPITFTARDYQADRKFIPRKLMAHNPHDPASEFKPVDLFNDLAYEGKIEIQISCLERAQYFGMAPADVYLRAADGSFAFNFVKGYISLWFQMFLITVFGVMFSTFLSGPVAMLATISAMVMGFFTRFVVGVAIGTIYGGKVAGAIEGGGPFESLVRLVTQMNVIRPMQKGVATTLVHQVDVVIMTAMRAVAYVVPDFNSLSTSSFVAYGFDVPSVLVLEHALTALLYFMGACTAAYFLFRSREIAA